MVRDGLKRDAVGKRDEFRRLLEEIQAGSAEAVQQLLDRYGPAILRVIRSRLDERMRSKFDSIDFLQDVWASFFRNPPEAAAFCSPDALYHFLTTLARNKVTKEIRQRLVYQKFNVNREAPQENPTAGWLNGAKARQPTPSQECVAKEQWEKAVRGRTQLQRKILEMLRDGYSRSEVSTSLGLSRKLVQRLVSRVAAGIGL
jgi:RNA polymerase sigma-70 factor (ECF subfamily)